MALTRHCHNCGEPWTLNGNPGRGETCMKCRADLRVCLNCAFYDKTRANECFEPQVEKVKEKDRSNYCDYFRFKEEGQQKDGRTEAEKAWKDIFK